MLLIGQRLAIQGTWDETPTPDGRSVIRLHPSIVWGTGYHPSTRKFLSHMEAGQVTPGMSVLDYGSGKGVLAIAAALLGATNVWATERHIEAIAQTSKNAISSGVSDVITVDQEVPEPNQFDLVLCNVDQREVAQDAMRHVAPGGLCVVTVEQTEQLAVEAEAIRLGLGRETAESYQQWVYLAFRRPADG